MANRWLFVVACGVLVAPAAGGCRIIREVLEHLDAGPGADAGAGSGGSGGAGGAGGAGGVADGGGSDGGPGGAIGTCGTLTLAATMRLAPAAAGQNFTRCQTLGPETGWHAVLSPDAGFLAARTEAGTVRLLDTADWHEVAQLASPLGAIDAVAFSPYGTTLATLSAEMGQVALWRTSDGMLVSTFQGPPASSIEVFASALAFSPDGTRLATSLGTLIDLTTGTAINWHTGAPVSVTPTVNPENLSTGGETNLRFLFNPDQSRILVDTKYRIGNSPVTERLTLVTPSTGAQTIFFEMYDRALTGHAVSASRTMIALAKTDEAEINLFPRGLSVFSLETGALLVADMSFTGQVLAFSPDASRLYTRTGDAIEVLDSADLTVVGAFMLAPSTTFLGLSPSGALVGAAGGMTRFWDPETGIEIRSFPGAATEAAWSADGRYGVSSGSAGTLFRLWREADGASLCSPPETGAPAPALATLGATLDFSGMATSADGGTRAVDEPVIHAHSADWTSLHVYDVFFGMTTTLRRVFTPAPLRRQIALAPPSGDTLYTQQGADVAGWCR